MNDFRIVMIELADKLKPNKILAPKDATIAITYKCNARCQMCNIWQTPQPADLPAAWFDNLTPKLRYINLSGGEPFLHPDLVEIVARIKVVSPRAQIIISSNGLATGLIIDMMKKILAIMPGIGIRISIDGLRATHNAIRNIPGIYEQAMATIAGLKRLGVKNLGLSFTIMDDNVSELKAVYDWSRAQDLELALALVQNSAIYFQKQDNRISFVDQVESGLDHIISQELKSLKPKRWARAFYDYGLKLYALSQERLLASGAGFDSLFIDPQGVIYPSNLIGLPMGNLAAGKLDNTWMAPPAKAVRQEIKNKNITESWIICTIRGEMKKHIFRVLFWMARNKFKYENSSGQ